MTEFAVNPVPDRDRDRASALKRVWSWLPTLYVAEALPYVVINTLTVLMYTKMDVDLEVMTFWTGWLYLPWVIKPFWSPFVDIFSSKRRWVLWMQGAMAISFACVASIIGTPWFFTATLAFFFMAAFFSATHDIAADGYYMLQLSDHEQAEYVGWRSTFYRLGSLFASGVLVWIAGVIEEDSAGGTGIGSSDIRMAWRCVMWIVAALLGAMAVYHRFMMPKASLDTPRTERSVSQVFLNLWQTFATFFTKKGVWSALAFMLLYRLPEALCIKIVSPFLVGARIEGGLELSTKAVGIANGVTGVVALLAGGVIGGMVIARGGLKKWLWPMALSLTLPCALYTLLAIFQPADRRYRPDVGECMHRSGAIRLRIRFYRLHALSHLFFRGGMEDVPLRFLHRFHGPWHDGARNVRRQALQPVGPVQSYGACRTAGIRQLFHPRGALQRVHMRGLPVGENRPFVRKEKPVRQKNVSSLMSCQKKALTLHRY